MASVLGFIPYETPKFDLLKRGASGYEIRRYHRQLRSSVDFNGAPDDSKAMVEDAFKPLAGYIFGANKKRATAKEDDSEKIAMTAPVLIKSSDDRPAGNQISTGGGEKIAMTAPVVMQTVTATKFPLDETSGGGENAATATPSTTDFGSAQKRTTMTFILPSKYKSISELPIPNDSRVKIETIEPYTVAALRYSGRNTPAVANAQKLRLLDMLRMDEDVKVLGAVNGDEASIEPIVAVYNPPFTIPFLRTNEVLIPVQYTPSSNL
jgi:hypothetical protein